jgi:hypothetical protein
MAIWEWIWTITWNRAATITVAFLGTRSLIRTLSVFQTV